MSVSDTPIRLRDESDTFDPRLDRLVHFDERSRSFPIRELIDDDLEPKTKWWGHTAKLDQGVEGACVGFAWAHDLAADPVIIEDLTDQDAFDIYYEAQKVDEWEGEDYSGTSVLAGAKILNKQGFLDEYRWAFGVDDVVLTLSHHGPVVLGIPWFYDMYTPDGSHRIRPTGRLVGGHAILALAYNHEAQVVWLLNSWGPDWGWDGLCKISVQDLDSLLNQQGEACVPVVRAWGEQGEPEDIEVEVDDSESEVEPDVVVEPEPEEDDTPEDDTPEPEPGDSDDWPDSLPRPSGYDRDYR